MTFPATSVPSSPDPGVEGGLRYVNRFAEIDSRKADGAVDFGLCVVDGAGELCSVPPNTSATADADGVIDDAASVAADTLYDIDAVNGVLGYQFNPARKLTVATSASNDFADSTATLRYMSAGRLMSEPIAITTDGGDAYTSLEFADEFVDLFFPAQAGTGGLITVGVTAELGDLRGGIALRDATLQLPADGTGYADEDQVGVYRGGANEVWVRVEDSVAKGAQCHVRLVATGSERVGAFRSDPDGTAAAPDAVVLRGATYKEAASAGELAPVRMSLLAQ